MKITEVVVETAAWQKKSGKNKNGGLNKKGVASYRKQHPGSKLKTAVTKKPSEIKKGSKDAKRRKSFCARMKGMKKHNTSAKTKHDPNSRINKSLRKWHCESVEELQELLVIAEAKIKQRLDKSCWSGYHKAGTKVKGGTRVNNCVKNEAANPAQQAAIAIAKKEKANESSEHTVNDFVNKFAPWVAEQLGIRLPKIVTLDQPRDTTFGQYVPDEKTIYLVTGGRHPVDVLRTLAHELTHHKQDINNNLPPGAGETGTDQENEANAEAGVMMRDFAQENPEYFGLTS
jgi:hypothetical protein